DEQSYGLSSVFFKVPVTQNEIPEEVFIPAPRKRNLVKILVIFLIINVVGALAAFVYWKFDDIKSYFPQSNKNQTTAVPDTSETEVNHDTTQLGQSIDTSTNIKNALRYEENPKIDTSSSIKTEAVKKYYIIAGSFQTYAKAEVHAKLLTKIGLKPEIIEFGQELFRVSIGEYTVKEDALKQLEFLKCKKETEKAWLLSK
ncbi:MAG TPA: SPOR domain-containing protein, partial [Bacteroidales bacterium]|nr:SPOR domain-containing protein [Bacteroidales bacterium]